ncbi:hypothetical protein PCE1_004956 [Barthelona sp. PCE]
MQLLSAPRLLLLLLVVDVLVSILLFIILWLTIKSFSFEFIAQVFLSGLFYAPARLTWAYALFSFVEVYIEKYDQIFKNSLFVSFFYSRLGNFLIHALGKFDPDKSDLDLQVLLDLRNMKNLNLRLIKKKYDTQRYLNLNDAQLANFLPMLDSHCDYIRELALIGDILKDKRFSNVIVSLLIIDRELNMLRENEELRLSNMEWKIKTNIRKHLEILYRSLVYEYMTVMLVLKIYYPQLQTGMTKISPFKPENITIAQFDPLQNSEHSMSVWRSSFWPRALVNDDESIQYQQQGEIEFVSEDHMRRSYETLHYNYLEEDELIDGIPELESDLSSNDRQ